jgi:hypothetical protein
MADPYELEGGGLVSTAATAPTPATRVWLAAADPAAEVFRLRTEVFQSSRAPSTVRGSLIPERLATSGPEGLPDQPRGRGAHPQGPPSCVRRHIGLDEARVRLSGNSSPPTRSRGRDRSGRRRASICRAGPTLNIEAQGTPRKADDGRRVILGLDPGLGLAKLP